MPTRVQIIHEVKLDDAELSEVKLEVKPNTLHWDLCFQWCQYIHENEPSEFGYRFIWRHPGGKLQPARGQARIPSLKVLKMLMGKLEAAGWGGETAAGWK
jgi:hypothetical protein